MKIKFLFFLLVFASILQAETPLERLIEGNKRFIDNKLLHPNRSLERREETAKKQEPFAIIVCCSDSRVSPEIIFDQGLGDLFIVRVAGNVAGPLEVASIEYSALYLHSQLILVLGHENCGAVCAVVEGQTKNIEPIASLIEPAVKATAKMAGSHLENTIKKNVQLVVEYLQNNPLLKELIDKKKLIVKGGYYNFHTGKVEL